MAAMLAAALIGSAPGALASDIVAGKSVYEKHCANCHGRDGYPVIPGTPDFTQGRSLMSPDSVLISSIKVGKKLMPGFSRVISEKDMLDVLSYIRTLQR